MEGGEGSAVLICRSEPMFVAPFSQTVCSGNFRLEFIVISQYRARDVTVQWVQIWRVTRLLFTNRKSHTGFLLLQKSATFMTTNGAISPISIALGPTMSKCLKFDPYFLLQKMSSRDSTFWRCIRCTAGDARVSPNVSPNAAPPGGITFHTRQYFKMCKS